MIKNNGQPFYLGVDIGGTSIYLVLVDEGEKIVNEQKVKTSNQISNIVMIINHFLAQSNITHEQIAFISCGVPGTTNSRDGIVIDAPALDWSNFPFIKEMMKYFQCKIYVDNDVNCAAIGEKWKGNAKRCENFIYISIGTGVGSAIIANNKLVRGSSFMAGEVGYLLFNQDIEKGNQNGFGEFGMLESKISGSALAKNGEDPASIFQDYYRNVPEAQEIIHTFERLLSISIANMVSLLNPEKVVISGGVALSLSGLIGEINNSVKKFTPVPVEVSLSSLGEASGAIGAVANGFNKECEKEKEWSW